MHAGKTRLRVFENDFIEDWFATAHPIVPGLWVLPFAAVVTWLSVGLESAAPERSRCSRVAR